MITLLIFYLSNISNLTLFASLFFQQMKNFSIKNQNQRSTNKITNFELGATFKKFDGKTILRPSQFRTMMQAPTSKSKFRNFSNSSANKFISVRQISHSIQNLKKKTTLQQNTQNRYQFKLEINSTEKEDDLLFEQSYKKICNLKSRGSKNSTELNNQLNQILDMIKEEKQLITATMLRINQKAEKYKTLYNELKVKQKQKNLLSEQSKEIYQKFNFILKQMQIDPKLILPQEVTQILTQEVETQYKLMQNEEIIRVQRFIIKKLADKLEQERENKKNNAKQIGQS